MAGGGAHLLLLLLLLALRLLLLQLSRCCCCCVVARNNTLKELVFISLCAFCTDKNFVLAGRENAIENVAPTAASWNLLRQTDGRTDRFR